MSLVQVGGGWQELQLSYFCGSSCHCSDPSSRAALQLAKANLETRWEEEGEARYAVVGVMEELGESLEVLEARLPRWFKGAAQGHTPHRWADGFKGYGMVGMGMVWYIRMVWYGMVDRGMV